MLLVVPVLYRLFGSCLRVAGVLVRQRHHQCIARCNGVAHLPCSATFGSLIGYLTLCLPLVILIQVLGISSIDRSQIEAARNLRANPIQTLYEVIFPSMKTSLVVAWLFAFILSFGDFVQSDLPGWRRITNAEQPDH